MEPDKEPIEVKLIKAQYYMNAANTLVLTGTIFILGFVTSLSVIGTKSDLLKMVMLGLLPLGMIALYEGISHYFRAQKLLKSAQTKPHFHPRIGMDILTFVLLFALFMSVNFLLYDTWMPSLLTVAILCLSALIIWWIKMTSEM